MCAIFGSRDVQLFSQLYEQNLVRGDFAYGGLYLTNNRPHMVKNKGKTVIGNHYDGIVTYYNGHTQAPTTAAQIYDYDSSHPFLFNNWIVSHNGVLTNHKQLRSKFSIISNSRNIVDSAIIPNLLSSVANTKKASDVDVIIEVLSLLEGTHSTTIYNTKTNDLYIARSGSTLFKDDLGNYSSTPFKGSYEVPDGVLYKYDNETFTFVGSFKSNSPFFI